MSLQTCEVCVFLKRKFPCGIPETETDIVSFAQMSISSLTRSTRVNKKKENINIIMKVSQFNVFSGM